MDKTLMGAHLVALRLGMDEERAKFLYSRAIAKIQNGDAQGKSHAVKRSMAAYEAFVFERLDFLAHYGPGYETPGK